MTMSTTVRSWSAIFVGVFFTGVTTFVLMADVLQHGAPITTKHITALAVLAGTVYFGHRWWLEARAFRVGTMLGCAILFLAGTATCVTMSAGRNAEVTTAKVQQANSVNVARSDALKDRDEAKARYLAALRAEESECSSGSGEKCQARRITRKLRREDFDNAEATLRAQAPAQVANADVAAAAQLFSKLPFVSADADALEALLLLLFPFLLSLFCEIAAITGFAIGLGHKELSAPVAGTVADNAPQAIEQPQTTVAATSTATLEEGWVPMSVAQARDLARKARAEDLFQELRAARNPLCNDELAKRLNINKGECSRRVTALKEAGLLHRQPAGRYVAISLRPLH